VIRVLLAEDQGMVRGAVASLLGLEPDIEVVAQVARGDEVISAARSVDPDVALLDIEMPGATGLEALAELRGARRGSGAQPRWAQPRWAQPSRSVGRRQLRAAVAARR
jgi:two-component system response regulator DesR